MNGLILCELSHKINVIFVITSSLLHSVYGMMGIKYLQQKISNLCIWKKGDQRAPHKPLLLLYVLSQYNQGHERLFNDSTEIEKPL